MIWYYLYLPWNSNDGAGFGTSIYQKVSDDLEAGVNLTWMAESNATHFGLGAKYVLDQDASISVSTGPLKTKYLITWHEMKCPELFFINLRWNV